MSKIRTVVFCATLVAASAGHGCKGEENSATRPKVEPRFTITLDDGSVLASSGATYETLEPVEDEADPEPFLLVHGARDQDWLLLQIPATRNEPMLDRYEQSMAHPPMLSLQVGGASNHEGEIPASVVFEHVDRERIVGNFRAVSPEGSLIAAGQFEGRLVFTCASVQGDMSEGNPGQPEEARGVNRFYDSKLKSKYCKEQSSGVFPD